MVYKGPPPFKRELTLGGQIDQLYSYHQIRVFFFYTFQKIEESHFVFVLKLELDRNTKFTIPVIQLYRSPRRKVLGSTLGYSLFHSYHYIVLDVIFCKSDLNVSS